MRKKKQDASPEKQEEPVDEQVESEVGDKDYGWSLDLDFVDPPPPEQT